MFRRTRDIIDRCMRAGTAETAPPKSQFDHEAIEHARRTQRAQRDNELAVEREKGPLRPG